MTAVRSMPFRLRRRELLSLAAATFAAVLTRPPLRAAGSNLLEATAEPVRGVLPNGLVVLVEERPSAETVALQLTARSGSRDDGDLPGINAVTSRMLLQGTTSRPSASALLAAVTGIGGQLSRNTGTESSIIDCLVPSTHAPVAFDVISDAVTNSLLAPRTLAGLEQGILQDQFQRRGNPSVLADDLFQATLFAGGPLGTPILGTPESIQSITPEAVQAYRAQYWGAANLVLTIAGRITTDAAMAAAQAYFGDLPAGSVNQRPALQALPPSIEQTARAESGQQIQYRLGYLAPSLRDAERYPMAVLNGIMSGFQGRLLRELRTRRGIAYSPYALYTPYSDTGAWFVAAGVDPQNLDEALSVTRDVIRGLRDAPPEAGELSDTIGSIAGALIVATETNAAVANRLASREVFGDVSAQEYASRAAAVTAEDIQRVAQTYLDPNREVLVLVGPVASAPADSPPRSSPSLER